MEETLGRHEERILAPDDFVSAKLIVSSKNVYNARKSFDAGSPNDTEPSDTRKESLSSKDARRRSSTLWDLQKTTAIPEGLEIKAFKRRWLVLTIFLLHAIAISFQWSMYSIIANIITKYYNVSNLSVDFTIMSFYIGYLVGFLPAGWCLNRFGLRWTVIIGAIGNLVGCFLRIFSVPPDRFWLTMIGQSIVAVAQAFLPMVPSRLAAVWFPAHQVSLACSIGYNGIFVGNAIGFLLPPIIVRNSDNLDDIGADLNWLYIGLAISAFVCLIMTIALLQEEPALPPSQAQKVQRMKQESEADSGNTKEFFASLIRLLKKRSFLLLLLSFALNVGVLCAVSAVLNQVLIPHFPGSEKEIGAVGLILMASGLVSSIICGFILDRTHAFKSMTLILYLMTFVGWVAFALLIDAGNIFWIFLVAGVLGFTTGVQPVGLEFSVEMTFPEPEGTSSALLIGSSQVAGVLFTLIYGYMLEAWGDITSSWIMVAPLALACLCVLFIRPKMKRQAAQRKENSQHFVI